MNSRNEDSDDFAGARADIVPRQFFGDDYDEWWIRNVVRLAEAGVTGEPALQDEYQRYFRSRLEPSVLELDQRLQAILAKLIEEVPTNSIHDDVATLCRGRTPCTEEDGCVERDLRKFLHPQSEQIWQQTQLVELDLTAYRCVGLFTERQEMALVEVFARLFMFLRSTGDRRWAVSALCKSLEEYLASRGCELCCLRGEETVLRVDKCTNVVWFADDPENAKTEVTMKHLQMLQAMIDAKRDGRALTASEFGNLPACGGLNVPREMGKLKKQIPRLKDLIQSSSGTPGYWLIG